MACVHGPYSTAAQARAHRPRSEPHGTAASLGQIRHADQVAWDLRAQRSSVGADTIARDHIATQDPYNHGERHHEDVLQTIDSSSSWPTTQRFLPNLLAGRKRLVNSSSLWHRKESAMERHPVQW
jgi:hypothetical protein